MDHHSILDRSSALPAVEGNMPGTSATRSATVRVPPGIATAGAHLPKLADPGPRFPGEDGGRSLAEMAYSDLDAALHLLAERAQYITGASGAAIALRRGQHNDMLCRASVGSNAPELGALLSMEYGLSGESVRTRQALRCDDAERDPRVNREGCRQLGIASVVVMPIVSEQQVLGVFELFSGKPRAFEERDISAVQRLSEMVETAVKHAAAMQTMPLVEQPAEQGEPSLDEILVQAAPVASVVGVMLPDIVPAPPVEDLPQREAGSKVVEKVEPEKIRTETETKLDPVPKKPLFWSAAMQTQGSSGRAEDTTASVSVPPMLRNLRKCQACGFPVSQGRAFCVECEERQWRGQRLSQPGAGPVTPQKATSVPMKAASAARPSAASSSDILTLANTNLAPDLSGSHSGPFSKPAPKSESWFAANKYVLGALLVVAIVIATIVWLR
jgi:GAF domain